MVKLCKHYYVSGRVQGVWYRASTEAKAKELGLTGWVKNLPDGRVELIACGEEDALQNLESWLWEGPSAADVNNVATESLKYQEYDGFRVHLS